LAHGAEQVVFLRLPVTEKARTLILLFTHPAQYRRFVAEEAAHTAQRPPDYQDPVPAGHVADAER